MKKILLLLCILSITISAKAQLFGKHWEQGNYYDLQGVKHTGLIAWVAPQKSLFSRGGDYIYYKPEKNAANYKIKSTELTSFTFGVDSFVVSKDEYFKWKPFLNVLVNTNDSLKLYRSMETRSTPGFGYGGGAGAVIMSVSASFSYSKKTYYYGPNQNELQKIDKKNFVDVTTRALAGIPVIVEKIKSKEIRDMEDVENALQQWAYSKSRSASAAAGTN
jgi:hypothetical protein